MVQITTGGIRDRLRHGRLDRRISILRKEIVQSPDGEILASDWVPVDASVPASYRPLSADERFQDPQLQALEQAEFCVRWGAHLVEVTPTYRVFYPGISIANPEETIPEARIYDIIAVSEIGRQRGLRIIAARRTDALAL